jgi:hypothetical protein
VAVYAALLWATAPGRTKRQASLVICISRFEALPHTFLPELIIAAIQARMGWNVKQERLNRGSRIGQHLFVNRDCYSVRSASSSAEEEAAAAQQ